MEKTIRFIGLIIFLLSTSGFLGCSKAAQKTNVRAPEIPTNLIIEKQSDELVISWDIVKNATSYHVFWSNQSGATISERNLITNVQLPYRHRIDQKEVAYFFVVTAINSNGESEPSNEVVFFLLPKVSIDPGDSKVTLNWDAKSELTYNVYWSSAKEFNKVSGNRIVGVTPPFVHEGLQNEKTFYYLVTFNLGNIESTESEIVQAFTKADPTANQIPIVTAGIDRVVNVGDLIYLDGSASNDPDGPTLSHQWEIVQKPFDSEAIIGDASMAVATYTADIEGVYVFNLTVSDGKAIASDQVSIIADAGATPVGQVITTFIVSQNGAGRINHVPVTFGQVFKPGDVPFGKTIVVKDSSNKPMITQLDVKARHTGLSLRHGIISFFIPSISIGQSLTYAIVASDPQPTMPSVDPLDLLSTIFDADINITIDGATYTASVEIDLDTVANSVWLQGPIVTEWLMKGFLVNADFATHPHLNVRYSVRAYQGLDPLVIDSALVTMIVENNWAITQNPEDLTYDVIVNFGAGNSPYSISSLKHYYHSRWRASAWQLGTEPRIHIKHDLGYLIKAGAVPKYDQTKVIPTSTIDKLLSSWAVSKSGPMEIGILSPDMSTENARPEIGPLPSWTAVTLMTNHETMKLITLLQGNLSGSWPVHYRDETTELPLSLVHYPNADIGGTLFPVCGNCSSPYIPDISHQPSLNYIPYLLTGEHYYLEELQFWATWNLLQFTPVVRGFDKGLINENEVRGQAWALRTLGEVAYITPDNHPMKSYFEQRLDFNLDWYQQKYLADGPLANSLGILANGSALSFRNDTGIAPWQDDFFTYVLGSLTDLGFTKARDLLSFKGKFAVDRMKATGYCWVTATPESLQVADALNGTFLSNFGLVYSTNFDDKGSVCGSQTMANVFSKQLNEPLVAGQMIGFSVKPDSYVANMQPALAAALRNGIPNAAKAWYKFVKASNRPDFELNPTFSIVP